MPGTIADFLLLSMVVLEVIIKQVYFTDLKGINNSGLNGNSMCILMQLKGIQIQHYIGELLFKDILWQGENGPQVSKPMLSIATNQTKRGAPVSDIFAQLYSLHT